MIILPGKPSKQRSFKRHELLDHSISPGDYFGTTIGKRGYVWHFDGTTAVRIGISSPDHLSRVSVGNAQTLRDALSTLPMFFKKEFILHRMALPPGAYFPQIARPNDQHPYEAPGILPDSWQASNLIMDSVNQVRILVSMLDSVFQTVYPVAANMDCFGCTLRNLLILSCAECEAQWRGIMLANGYVGPRNTTDYVKLLPAMRLSEYEVKLQRYPWLSGFAPFRDWDISAPT